MHIKSLVHISLLRDAVHNLQVMLLLVNMQKMLNRPKKVNIISTEEVLLQNFSPSLNFAPFIFLKTNWETQAGFSLVTYHVMNVPKGT